MRNLIERFRVNNNSSMSTEKSVIAEFYKNKNVFITGGSGFIGKCLIEKLLRSCPDLGKIYMLLRPKKGKSLEERLEEVLGNLLFDEIRKKTPEVFSKIVLIKGDVAELELGISKTDRQTLIDNVNVIFHTAASVRFDDSLKKAIMVNVRSSREIAEFALETKNLTALLHTSTTYCNIDKKVIEEKLYPSYGYWRDAILLAEEGDEEALEALTLKFISPFPNTYTFTKLLAEHCVNELCVGKIRTVIYRPSVVISSIEEPISGYIDNFNGPVGLLLAGGTGMLRTVYGNRNVKTDYFPVDLTVKAMIVAVWDKTNTPNSKNELTIYNGSKNDTFPISLGYLVERGRELNWDVPFERTIWFPRYEMTSCFYEYYMYVILCHVLPAIFLDLLLIIFKQKPMFFKIQRRIYIGNTAINHFMLNEWSFINTNQLSLNDRIPTDIDKKEFGYKMDMLTEHDIYNFYKNSCFVAKHLLLKEGMAVKPETIIRTRRMYYLDIFVKTISWITVAYLVFYKFNILCFLCKCVTSYWNSL